MVDLFGNVKMTETGMAVSCSYCLNVPVPAIKKCLPCEATLCEDHLRVHSKSSAHTLTDVHAPPTLRRCPHHDLDFSSYCRKCKTCLCFICKWNLIHVFHVFKDVVNLRDAHEDKKKRLNDILVELMTKKEKIPRQIQQLEMARDTGILTQKIGNIVFLVNTDDPLTVLQEKESERSDFCDIQESDKKIREIQEECRRVLKKDQIKKNDYEMLFILPLFAFLYIFWLMLPKLPR